MMRSTTNKQTTEKKKKLNPQTGENTDSRNHSLKRMFETDDK